MRRSGQPSRPRARICCLLSSPKMLAIPAGNHALHRRVNVLGRRYFTGRFSGVHDWPVLGVHRGLRTWTADGAWPGEAECRGKMRERIQLAQPPSEQLREYELNFKTIESEDYYTTVGEDAAGQQRLLITVQFLCLPDTVDPRGPKAR